MAERDWTEEMPQPGMRTLTNRAELAMIAPPELWQIAGDIAAFSAAHPSDELGFGGELSTDSDALIRLGRDNALWRPGSGNRPAPGWKSNGYAALEATDGWAAFALTGTGADDHLRRFVALDLLDGSPSAATSFADIKVVILRQGTGWQIWCNTSDAWSIWLTLSPTR